MTAHVELPRPSDTWRPVAGAEVSASLRTLEELLHHGPADGQVEGTLPEGIMSAVGDDVDEAKTDGGDDCLTLPTASH